MRGLRRGRVGRFSLHAAPCPPLAPSLAGGVEGGAAAGGAIKKGGPSFRPRPTKDPLTERHDRLDDLPILVDRATFADTFSPFVDRELAPRGKKSKTFQKTLENTMLLSRAPTSAAAARRAAPVAAPPRPAMAPAARPRTVRAAASGERVGKADLVEAVAAAVPSLSKRDAGEAVDAVFETIAAALAAGGEASVVGFGSFKVGERAAREGRNPRTGEAIPIAASKAPKFTAGKALKDRVNGEGGGKAGAAGAKTPAAAAAGRKTTASRATSSSGAAAPAGRKTAARRSTKSK